MYKINDRIVYPGHGVATIQEQITKIVASNKVVFYKLRFLYKDMTILVPTHNVENVGIRALSSKQEVEKSLALICAPQKKNDDKLEIISSGWNKRNKEYQLLIERGLLIEVAAIYRDIMRLSLHKDLSFGEKNLLQVIEDLLTQEIVEVRGSEKVSVLQELRAPFKAFQTHAPTQQQPPSAL